MADGTTRDEKRIIAVAAAVAGREPDSMTIEEAREVLRGGGDNKILDDTINKAAQALDAFLDVANEHALKTNPAFWNSMIDLANKGNVTAFTFPYSAEIADTLYDFAWTPGPDQETGTSAADLERLRRATAEINYKNLFFTASFMNILGGIAKGSGGEPADNQERAEQYSSFLTTMRDVIKSSNALFDLISELQQLDPFMRAELDAAGEAVPLIEIYKTGIDTQTGTVIPGSRLESLMEAARTAAAVNAQQTGRNQRRQLKTNALEGGAIMGFQGGNLVVFSEKDLWNAFTPERIAKIGTLNQDEIDDETGEVVKNTLEQGEITPVSAQEISYKAFVLMNTIFANSVENYRERFFRDGAIKFYVKGVIDALDIDPRPKEDGATDAGRKTAGALYLEKQFRPLLPLIGKTPEGSRYSVLNYVGYDINTDTITIRSPYLFQLWKRTQLAFHERKKAKQARLDEGKNPLKKDLKPLEVNELFKFHALKEDETALEIATYITNVMLAAGSGAHKTEINFKTIIKECPRLREKLKEIEAAPTQENGKRINKTARYNSELRKIARAYNIIMDPNKCDATRYYTFDEFTTTEKKQTGREGFVPPTKSALDEKIIIKWHKNDL